MGNLALMLSGIWLGAMLLFFAVSVRLSALAARPLEESARRGVAHPFLYTKPKNARLFRSLGFFPVAETADMLMMEHRRGGVERYIASLPAYDGESGAVVCHANPFTRGHRHLVEYAAARCPHLYVFVLSEETGDFPAADRLELVRRGTADLPNVDVVPGGDYIISRATFPAYFLQGDPEQARCDLELTLFGKRIAPALGITRRFVGQEPYSPVTARYNAAMAALREQIRTLQMDEAEKARRHPRGGNPPAGGHQRQPGASAAAPGPPGGAPTPGAGDDLCILSRSLWSRCSLPVTAGSSARRL